METFCSYKSHSFPILEDFVAKRSKQKIIKVVSLCKQGWERRGGGGANMVLYQYTFYANLVCTDQTKYIYGQALAYDLG